MLTEAAEYLMNTATVCWHCGFENPSGAKFCANCGKPQHQVCPECGAEVVEGAKFCANCGIPLKPRAQPQVETSAPVLTAETRKVVTVLFADLVGSTGLTERLDPEEAREVVGKFYDVVQHVVERWFEGTVANLLGDAVLAVFGLPVAHEDDPERAVRAGLGIRDAIPVLNNHLSATHGVQLAVRIGINTGEVVAASGSTFERDFLVSDAVTTAARLQQTVAPGTVVVGERTFRLTKDTIEYRELPPMAVKGKETALAVWSAVAPLPEHAEVRRVTAPLVGRHAELGLLRHLYERGRDEARVHLVTILGQPGVGKSRLLREFLAETRDTDPAPLVLRGRSVAFGGQIGYHALLDILRSQAGLLDTDAPEVVQTKLQAWLQEMLPDRGDLLDGLVLTFGTQDGAGADPGQMRQRLFESWRTLVSGLAASRPVILALEDLHWADEGLLDLAQWIAETPDSVLLFVICVARPELIERRPNWGGGRRNVTTIDLPPLRPQEAMQLTLTLSSQGLSPEMIQLIAQRAEGNPLFVEELVRMMLEGSTPDAAIPDTVQAVLTARIDRLALNERRVLQAAAVIGRTFWPSAAAPIAGLPLEETAKAIEALINKELVTSRPRSTIADEHEYAFRHILTRDVAYNMLPKAQRQRAHAEAARWLELKMGERVEEVVEILAEHLRVSGEDARAATYLHRAGNKARRLYANADAIRLFDQALDAATRAGVPPQSTAVIHLDRGDVHQLLGQYEKAMADYEQGRGAAQQAGDRTLEAMLESRVGLIYHREHRLDEAEAHYAGAAALAREAGDQLTLGQSLVDLANISWDRGKLQPDDPTITEGLRLVHQVGDQSSLARGLNMLCMSHLRVGNGAAAIAAAEEARAAAHAAGDKSKEATSISYLSVVNGYRGHFREAIEYARQALALAQEIGDRRRIAYALHFLGRPQLGLGQIGEAIGSLEESLRLALEVTPGHLPWPHFHLGVAFDEVGDLERARAHFQAASQIDPKTTTWWQIILASRVIFARLTQDVAALNQALHGFDALPWTDFIPATGDILMPVGEGLLELGKIAELRGFIVTRRSDLERLGSRAYLASLAVLEARLAVRDGDASGALTYLDRAIRLSDESSFVLGARHAYELRLTLLNQDSDRAALRSVLQRIAESLPEQLRATFLASPRTAVLRE